LASDNLTSVNIDLLLLGKATPSSTSPTTIASAPTLVVTDLTSTTEINASSIGTSGQSIEGTASSDKLPASGTYHDENSGQEDELNTTLDTIELLARTDEIEKECRTQLSYKPTVDKATKDESKEVSTLPTEQIAGPPTLTVDTEATEDPSAPGRSLSLMELAQEGLETVRTACKGFFMEDGIRKSSRIRSKGTGHKK
jgi:hypothetical protein